MVYEIAKKSFCNTVIEFNTSVRNIWKEYSDRNIEKIYAFRVYATVQFRSLFQQCICIELSQYPCFALQIQLPTNRAFFIDVLVRCLLKVQFYLLK